MSSIVAHRTSLNATLTWRTPRSGILFDDAEVGGELLDRERNTIFGPLQPSPSRRLE
ncbi:hypothetical protein I6F26_24385 [Ensifer sp. IC3342]|nr:hypothetical protein [Ensifer sp. IC4062]MCA1408463.1 hypothetical protein [Ensifer sp. BRP08]MCA1444359.1 hypothetical protein [Ensifer sp. IC4062]MCA1449713.1 hypothetical protein [Ensifer sp. IC3342]